MQRNAAKKIKEAILNMESEFEWFKKLEEKEKFYFATKYINTKREDLQRARMWISLIHTIVPWGVALYALFSK